MGSLKSLMQVRCCIFSSRFEPRKRLCLVLAYHGGSSKDNSYRTTDVAPL